MNLGWGKLMQTEGPNPDAPRTEQQLSKNEQNQNKDLCVKSQGETKAASTSGKMKTRSRADHTRTNLKRN
jgi:hypothetical protein